MLLSESELNMYDADSILSESEYLDESESITKLQAIPVVENSRLDCGVVSFTDIESIVEDYGCDYEDAFCAIAEQNEIDPNTLAVSVEDWKLIESPELVDLVPNIVVKPISENNIVYQFCDYAVSALSEDAITDEEFYDAMLDEFSLGEFIRGMGKAQLQGNPIQIEDVNGTVKERDDSGKVIGISVTDPATGDKYTKGKDGKWTLTQTRRVPVKGKLSKKAAAGYIAAGAGVALGASLAAKKIAALRRQQKKNPSMRGRIQKAIDALKKKLHRK